jgi:hypothetical protein
VHGLSKERVIQELLTPARVFPKVVDILGADLLCSKKRGADSISESGIK